MAIVTDVSQMVVGDKIRAKYTATSGAVGTFSQLGTANNTLIPASSSTTPNGDFYFIMVDTDYKGRKVLVADRNIQLGISWDTLNTAGIASGSGVPVTIFASVSGNLCTGGTATGSSGSTTPVSAFDGNLAYPNHWYYQTPAPFPVWIQYAFATAQAVNKIRILSYYTSGYESIKNFQIIASNTGAFAGEEVTLYTGTHPADNITTFVDYKFTNDVAYKYVRAVVLDGYAGNGGDNIHIMEIEMHREVLPSFNDITTVRLLTGGISATDTDNEWDKYIVNSTLNGTITAGDTNVWNWGVYTLSSTSITATPANKAKRGNVSVGTHGNSTTLATSGNGFRPVLLVESLNTNRVAELSDTILLSETLTQNKHLSKFLVNNLLLSDNISASKTVSIVENIINLSDTISINDNNIIFYKSSKVNLSDLLNISDSIIANKIDFLTVIDLLDSINLNDSIERKAMFRFNFNDNLIINDEELSDVLKKFIKEIRLIGSHKIILNLDGSKMNRIHLKGALPLSKSDQNIELFAGEYKEVIVKVIDEDTQAKLPMDLSNYTIKWCMRKIIGGANVITKQSPEITYIGDGEVLFILNTVDTTNLLGDYLHQLEIVDPSGKPNMVCTGRVYIDKNMFI